MTVDELLALHRDTVDESGLMIRQLHGLSLQKIMEALCARYSWAQLAAQVPINCFSNNPSIKSSLTFLRRTPWAREKVEAIYIAMRTADVLQLPLDV